MFDSPTIFAVAVGYLLVLFAIAWLGDRMTGPGVAKAGRPLIYGLSIATYCTSWTYFGSVGLAARTGYDFVPVYLGPILMFTIGLPLIIRIVRLAKTHNLTSVADFMAARYGKSQSVAALVTLVAVVGALPYIALQLKAISVSLDTLLGSAPMSGLALPGADYLDTALVITLMLAAFAVLFGTRHIDATEHQQGLMLAIAVESVVKLAAFLTVGLFVVFIVMGGPQSFLAAAEAQDQAMAVFSRSFNGGTWLTVTFLSFVNIILLPRQFHVTVVENNTEGEIRRASWLFPLYLILINLLVVPIAAAGLLTSSAPGSDPDFFVVSLSVGSGNGVIAMIAFIGGLSAATAMVVVESIALAIMLSNGLVIPALIRNRSAGPMVHEDMAGTVLAVRRVAIVALMLLGYGVFAALGDAQVLASIGLISFAAIAQLAPAFFLGLFWRKGTASGAIAGISTGFVLWAYTLLLPWVAKAGWIDPTILREGLLGVGMLRPEALLFLHFEPLTHGVLWSIGANTIAYVTVSVLRAPLPVERLQAGLFVPEDQGRLVPANTGRMWRSAIKVGEVKAAVARYLGPERAERSFQQYAATRGLTLDDTAEADLNLVRFAEHVLASSIGAASARLVLALLLRRGNVTGQRALQLLDDASEALQYNRDLLQSALDQVRHGLSVFDKDMRLICWNREFRELVDLPPDLARVGMPLDRILRFCAERGDYGPGDVEEQVAQRLLRLAVTKETYQEPIERSDRVLEIRTSAMPQGGIVTTYSDITEQMKAAMALERANETLERRVRERTAELLEVNSALAIAKTKADSANLDKTRFLAAASHDILQPLNAARLYASSLAERPLDQTSSALAGNVDASLVAVEEIFSTLIDISRMDAGRMETEIAAFPLSMLFNQLKVEFEPVAAAKGLSLRIVATSLWVRSDRKLLRRVLQNLLSNAIKYTRRGGIVLGVRWQGDSVAIEVVDTGPGIPADKHEIIFREFQRLEGAGSSERGLGLGLSIVERICRLLDHPIDVISAAGSGSVFRVKVPRTRAGRLPEVVAEPANVLSRIAGGRVLCIDNEPAILAGMAALLDGWRCQVTTASSVASAVDAVRDASAPPQIILADYHLDLGTGLDAIKSVRAAAGVDIPAIIITADHTPDVERTIREAGIGLLRKPLKAAALRALMSQMLLARRVAAE
ncbi:MAG: PAS domain-containing hybrid sensor histidine kinase/response regulator [Hyphomicrobiaceae bacterium]|nr:PAS domain-containing hybrid sensor histidine kinase/response regulator [Hyphomicrobiaceae bacterium]